MWGVGRGRSQSTSFPIYRICLLGLHTAPPTSASNPRMGGAWLLPFGRPESGLCFPHLKQLPIFITQRYVATWIRGFPGEFQKSGLIQSASHKAE